MRGGHRPAKTPWALAVRQGDGDWQSVESFGEQRSTSDEKQGPITAEGEHGTVKTP